MEMFIVQLGLFDKSCLRLKIALAGASRVAKINDRKNSSKLHQRQGSKDSHTIKYHFKFIDHPQNAL